MNKTFFVHGVWLIMAILSFVAGAVFFPGEEASLANGTSSGDGSGIVLVTDASSSMGHGAGSPVSRQGLSDSTTQFSAEDIRALGETFRTATSPIARRLAFSSLLEGLTADNALLIREQIEHLDHRSAEFREFHYAWGAVAGVEAAMFGASTPEDDMSPAIAGWAGTHPGEAIAWFNNLDMENDPEFEYLLKERKVGADGLRSHLMRGLVQGLADGDPMAASDFVHSMAGKGEKGAEHLMHTVAQAVMRSDGAAKAATWSETLPDGAPKMVAMHRTANGLANEDPEAAAEWVGKFSDQSESAGVIGEVGVTWSRKDPQAALEWLSEIPEGRGQQVGMHRTLNEWAERDPTAASEYLAAMPASAAKDAAIGGFSGRLAWEDPHAAIAWAETISSDQGRTAAIIRAGQNWSRKDASAAAEWAVSAGLPENVKRAILNPSDDNRRR